MKNMFKVSIASTIVSLLFSFGYMKLKGIDNPHQFLKDVMELATEMGALGKDKKQCEEGQCLKQKISQLERKIKDIEIELEEKCYVFIRNKYLKCREDNTYVVDGETIYYIDNNRIPASELSELNPNVKALQSRVDFSGDNAQGILKNLEQAKKNIALRNKMLEEIESDYLFTKRQ